MVMLLFLFDLLCGLLLGGGDFLLDCLAIAHTGLELLIVSLLAFIHLKLNGLNALGQHA